MKSSSSILVGLTGIALSGCPSTGDTSATGMGTSETAGSEATHSTTTTTSGSEPTTAAPGSSSSSGTTGSSSDTTGTTSSSSDTAPTTTGGIGSSSTTEAAGACGDGAVDPGEECDEGRGNGDGAACNGRCQWNVCGDGDQGPGEACDDGNADNDDGCTAMCQPAACGDGFVQPGEQCDDANVEAGDGCDDVCQVEATRRVFVTSTVYTGDLGGLDGADAECQARAEAANLSGSFRAWLSDDTGSPSTRMSKAGGPFVLVTGVKIADDWADLTDGAVAAAISIDEFGGPAPVTGTLCDPWIPAWSNTEIDGTQYQPNNSCGNWTGVDTPTNWGLADAVDETWTAGGCIGGPGFCQGLVTLPMYCFQQ